METIYKHYGGGHVSHLFYRICFISILLGLASAACVAQESVHWKLRSKHFAYGMPVPIDARHDFSPEGLKVQPGISVLAREGFVVGHYDKYKVPAWVSMQWTRDDYWRSKYFKECGERDFQPDEELPTYARATKDYDFSTSRMQRGHMARQQDNWAWGHDNVDAGCLMSNIVPQHERMNPKVWLTLESSHREVVSRGPITRVWVISGPIFKNNVPESLIGRSQVGVPSASYKVIGWYDADHRFHVRGYVIDQNAEDVNEEDLTQFIEKVDVIESMTGLDFFPELEDYIETSIESNKPENMWDT